MTWLQAAARAALAALYDNVQTLDQAPVVGKVYMVPTVLEVWCDLERPWPVITPSPHCDRDGLWDWHLDYRFLTPEQEAAAARWECHMGTAAPLHDPARRWIGSRVARNLTMIRYESGDRSGAALWPPVVFRPRVCRRPTIAPEPLAQEWDLAAHYGSPAPAICTPSGRVLCPHQKMDLTHWPREADGTVICPLHRLRVSVPTP